MNLLLPGMHIAADSPIHRLDPRLKMITATMVMVLPFTAPSIASQVALAAFVLTVSALALVPRRPLLHTLRTVFWIGCFMFVYQAFTTPGEPVLHWRQMTVTWTGLASGASQVYRLCLLVITAALLTYVALGERMSWPQMIGVSWVVMAIIVLQFDQERIELAPQAIRASLTEDQPAGSTNLSRQDLAGNRKQEE